MSESKFKSMRHIETVRNYLNLCIREILDRAERHDQSKMEKIEVETFEQYTPKLRTCTYGSDEYKGFLKEMEPALQNHYANNRHHPEHFVMWQCVVCKQIFKDSEKYTGPHDDDGETYYCPKCCEHGMIYECGLKKCSGINGMNLIDLLEMVIDWKCSGMRHNNGDLLRSIEINKERFGMSDQLAQIFKNTAEWINAQNVYHKANES